MHRIKRIHRWVIIRKLPGLFLMISRRLGHGNGLQASRRVQLETLNQGFQRLTIRSYDTCLEWPTRASFRKLQARSPEVAKKRSTLSPNVCILQLASVINSLSRETVAGKMCPSKDLVFVIRVCLDLNGKDHFRSVKGCVRFLSFLAV